jgi:hypothetical protein
MSWKHSLHTKSVAISIIVASLESVSTAVTGGVAIADLVVIAVVADPELGFTGDEGVAISVVVAYTATISAAVASGVPVANLVAVT